MNCKLAVLASKGAARIRRAHQTVWRLAFAAALLIAHQPVRADGGAVRLREAAGPFIITVFTAPASCQASSADVSVMVQRRDTDEVVLDATVDLFLTPPAGMTTSDVEPFCGPDGTPLRSVSLGNPREVRSIRATHERATNKLLYAATTHFPVVGVWKIRVAVEQSAAVGRVQCDLPVTPGEPRLAELWPELAVPPVLVFLFAVHQRLRHSRPRRAGKSEH